MDAHFQAGLPLQQIVGYLPQRRHVLRSIVPRFHEGRLLRTRHRSSPKVTSKLQCSEFSMLQWLRPASSSRPARASRLLIRECPWRQRGYHPPGGAAAILLVCLGDPAAQRSNGRGFPARCLFPRERFSHGGSMLDHDHQRLPAAYGQGEAARFPGTVGSSLDGVDPSHQGLLYPRVGVRAGGQVVVLVQEGSRLDLP